MTTTGTTTTFLTAAAARFIRWGAVAAFVGVALGAFGAHALQENLHMSARYLDVWRTGVQYHLLHALALLVVGALFDRLPQPRFALWTGQLFALGILVFGGSLYLLALSSLSSSGPVRLLGAITPLGGVCFLTGWALLFFASLGAKPEKLDGAPLS